MNADEETKVKSVGKDLMWKTKHNQALGLIGIPDVEKPTNGTQNATGNRIKEILLKQK